MMPDRYQHQELESALYTQWEEKAYFAAQDRSTKPPFSIILPPPNVTGFLHIGHALDQTIQDALVRWKRMSGYNAMWLPGTDHAGIATQTVVEKELAKQGLTRQQLGREEFLKKVWEWKHAYGDRIYRQMRRLGNSLDWNRAVFTLDEGVSQAVRKVFVTLYKKGLIYRGTRLVNWSGPLETAISDLEVEHKEVKGTLWHIRYPLSDGSGYLVVATTRPETMLGDVAVCVHPQDERYKHLIGKHVKLPLTSREIPIIADDYVDPQFGSGVVKITPAHDFNDYKVAMRHQLPMINILDKRCYLNESAGSYQGLDVKAARKKVLQDLKALELIEKEEPHTHSVGHCSRTGAVVEPYLSEQWFVKMESLARPARHVVESGTIQIEPESWTKVYLHWLNNIEDWCISRQLWWGHRIPAWYCRDCGHTTVSETDPQDCEKCHSKNIIQDEDVLDTWFSSALWPFSTLGWPKETEALSTFYPTSVLVTGHDILFFWVARMVMMGLEFMGDVPFRKVYLHGLVRDAQGRKMSKSLGNSVDPVEMIEKYGADALRMTFLAHIHSGKDFKFSEERLQGYRNFINKIWNATRYALGRFEALGVSKQAWSQELQVVNMSSFDHWILHRLLQVESQVHQAWEQYRFSDAAGTLYQFMWHEFCDWYIEFSKPIFESAPTAEKVETAKVMRLVLERALRLLSPMIPFVTEYLYSQLPATSGSCMLQAYPSPHNHGAIKRLVQVDVGHQVELIKGVLHAIRNIRGENRLSPALELEVRLQVEDEGSQKVLSAYKGILSKLGRTKDISIASKQEIKQSAVMSVAVEQYRVQVIIPLSGLIDLEEEIKRLEKNLLKVNQSLGALVARLGNEKFIKNADPEVVESDKAQAVQLRFQKESLEQAIVRLKMT